ncbi:MAG TPA: DUF58 domain-containing protein [Microthrixaceae bacterium]|nr:DUF58 domain-containing protein [Microthrixaceae bacterium]
MGFVPTRRLAIVAFVVGVALLFYPGELPGGLWGSLALVNGLLLAVAVVDSLMAPSSRWIRVERVHPPMVVLGATAPLSWAVTNDGSRRARVSLADALGPSLHASITRVALVVPPHGDVVATTDFRPSRRGRFDLSEVTLRLAGPLGLASRESRRTVRTILRVHPPFRSRDEAELRIRKARILEVGLRSARGLGGGTEFEQLREYSPDDEFRKVDWAASARMGKPIVRTYRPERNQTVIVMFDSGRLMAARVGDAPRLEHSMDATIMLSHVATRLGDRVGMVTFDAVPRAIVPPSRSHDQTARITEALYALEPALTEADYRGAFTAMTSRFRRRSLIVVLSDLIEQSVEESLLPALPMLLRRHVVLVGAVRDPEVVAWAGSTATEPSDAYRRAAATNSLAERDRLVARLRGMGVTVVDAPPGRLATSLTDAYLHIKSTGRL